MPETINTSIVKNYITYRKVRYENKKITIPKVRLGEVKGNNNNFKYGNCQIESKYVNDAELIIEAHKKDVHRYGFKLKAKSISERPFFRFDASGSSHDNRSPLTPLVLRQISTPHFQFYDELGYNTAYQTEILKDTNIVDNLRGNINIGIEIFCQESVTFTNGNGIILIERDPGLLFKAQNIDPLIDENFDES